VRSGAAWADTHRSYVHGKLLLAGHPHGIDGMDVYDRAAVVHAIFGDIAITAGLRPGAEEGPLDALDRLLADLTEKQGITTDVDADLSALRSAMHIDNAQAALPTSSAPVEEDPMAAIRALREEMGIQRAAGSNGRSE
jgi:hypothetical protein